MATLRATSLPEPSAVVTIPSASNVVSSVPLELYRTTAKSSFVPFRVDPTTTILPLLCIATPYAWSRPGLMEVVTQPGVKALDEKDESNDPLVLYRTTAKLLFRVPTTIIFPSL